MIRRANESDSQAVFDIAQSLSIKKLHNLTKGFLVYVLPASGYAARIRLSPYFYVSEDSHKIDGFIMCYDNNTLNIMEKDGILSHEDGIIGFVRQMPEPYIFGDQIGVDPNAQQKGIGAGLWDRLITDMKKHNIHAMYAAILHAPTRNTYSINYHKKMGLKQIGEVRNKDNNVWGIYKYTF